MTNREELVAEPFLEAGEQIAKHPFLAEAREARLSPHVWAAYVGKRLGAGTSFVEYLVTLAGSAQKSGHADIHAAVQSNLDEELGIVHGQPQLERTHDEWRRWFRDDMKTILGGENFEPEIPESTVYPQVLHSLSARGDVVEMTGALTGLEILIAREYELILAGLERQFGNRITTVGYTYIRSHAHHDHRHFREIFVPLQAVCHTRKDIDRAMSGLQQAQKAKTTFLDGMENYRLQKS